jgi:hypothetical protein
MPLIEAEKASADAANVATSRKARREKRQEARTGKASETAGKEAEITPLTEAQMLNLPGSCRVGSLSLVLTCPTIGRAARLQQRIYEEWPDILLFAFAADRSGKGIDPAGIAEVWTANRNASAPEGEVPEPVTLSDVREQLTDLSLTMSSALPGICNILWEVASETPGIAWPRPETQEGEETPPPPAGYRWLDKALLDTMTIPLLVDLLRALLGCMGGFTGDVGDRFTKP